MTDITRTCRDCNQLLAENARSDAKTCPRCRWFRTLGYVNAKFLRPKTCRGCGKKFRPLHARALTQCVDCNPRFGKLAPVECKLCKQERAPLESGVPVCIYCASHPDKQKQVVRAFRIGQSDRRKQY